MKFQISPQSRVVRDVQNDAIRSFFDTTVKSSLNGALDPRGLARATLEDNADQLKWSQPLQHLRDGATLDGQHGYSVRFTQEWKGVPVDDSEVVVNMYKDGRVYAVYNHYHYDIPNDLDPRRIRISAAQALELLTPLVDRLQKPRIQEPRLIIYRYRRIENHPPKPPADPTPSARLRDAASAVHAEIAAVPPREGQYFIAWDIRVRGGNPIIYFRFLIDAMTGRLIQAIDLAQYASGTARVFDPNPIVTSGNTGLASTSNINVVNNERVLVNVDRLNPPDGQGKLHLDGQFVRMEEIDSPQFAEPTSASGDFSFSWTDGKFLSAMAYYHIDTFQNYVQTVLGMNNVANFSMQVDAQSVNGGDNSFYIGNGQIIFGGPAQAGNPVPDAADAMVVLHEYGHAMQDDQNPGFDNPLDGTGEGFGDFLAAVYYDAKHTNPANTRGIMMSWDANTTDASWPGRRYDVNWLFDSPQYTGSGDNHTRGQLWCAAMFEIYRKLGGDSQWYPSVRATARDLVIRLHLMANFKVSASGSTAPDMGQEIEAADGALGGWNSLADRIHQKVIYDTFRRRHLGGYSNKAVDVYIDDGRDGGYGSLSGNDAFNEVLFMDCFWETQDIWVKTSPYPDAQTQATGGPGDHIEPPVNSTAYLYVRVKNRGTSAAGSGPVTVKAFHCNPGLGLVWPDAWTAMDVPSLPIANVLPGANNAVIVGPFTWTPTEVGHECVLAIVECANDHAVTQDLQVGDHVRHSDLVPFDNNIAQRNLNPTPAKGTITRGFWVNNPDAVVRTIQLDVHSTLPEGWRWRFNLADPRSLRLGPLDRRWVEVTIDQAGGSEVTRFDQSHQLRVVGTIEGRTIGGITFYVAPPKAFPEPGIGDGLAPGTHSHVAPGQVDLCCLGTLIQGAEFDGEIDVKIRFHRK